MIPWLLARIQPGDDMPLVKKLTRVGDATGVILDPEILREVDIETDSEVEISVENSAIVIRPSRYAGDDDTRAAGRDVIRNRRRLLERLSK
jgi:antitoxin component of MazEF toxin-antitoxin module